MKRSFLLDRTIGPIYEGECRIASLLGSEGLLVPIHSRVALRGMKDLEPSRFIGPEPDSGIEDGTHQSPISSVYGFDSSIILARSMGLIEVYDMDSSCTTPIRSWKTSDNASVSFLTCEYGMVATGFTDGSIRLYSLEGGFCMTVLKGRHKGPVTRIVFLGLERLLSSGEDGCLVEWDVSGNGRPLRRLPIHTNAVTSVILCDDCLVTASRDGTVTFLSKSLEITRSLSAAEAVQDMCISAEGVLLLAGESGVVRSVSPEGVMCVSKKLCSDGHTIRQIIALTDSSILAVTSENTFHRLDPRNLKVSNTFVGSLGEITDMQILSSGELAVATSDPSLKIFASPGSLSCRMFCGHTSAIVSIASSGNMIVTGSRDGSIRMWTISSSDCFYCGLGHTDVVTAVAICELSPDQYLVASGSADLTIKLWHINGESVVNLWTLKAHDRDINALAFSSAQWLTSGSQDKTVKIWNVQKGIQTDAVLTGHKRGVWSVSCYGDLVASSSSDKTIKLWSMSSRQLLKTLEGHNNSVLRVSFTVDGTQLVSVDSDGVLKIWDTKKALCVETHDDHNDRVWAIAMPSDSSFVISGDCCGVRNIWRDASEEISLKLSTERAKTHLKEQELMRLVHTEDYPSALRLTLEMDQPGRSYSLVTGLVRDHGLEVSSKMLHDMLKDSDQQSVQRALEWAKEWNSNFKRSLAGCLVLRAILSSGSLAALAESHKSLRASASDLVPFLDRHIRKLQDLQISSHMADLSVLAMDA